MLHGLNCERTTSVQYLLRWQSVLETSNWAGWSGPPVGHSKGQLFYWLLSLPAWRAAPLQQTRQQPLCPEGLCTVNLADVNCSATTIAVRLCNVGSVQSISDSPSAIAMNMISWSCSLHAYKASPTCIKHTQTILQYTELMDSCLPCKVRQRVLSQPDAEAELSARHAVRIPCSCSALAVCKLLTCLVQSAVRIASFTDKSKVCHVQ